MSFVLSCQVLVHRSQSTFVYYVLYFWLTTFNTPCLCQWRIIKRTNANCGTYCRRFVAHKIIWIPCLPFSNTKDMFVLQLVKVIGYHNSIDRIRIISYDQIYVWERVISRQNLILQTYYVYLQQINQLIWITIVPLRPYVK